MTKPIILAGALDTKGIEFQFVRDLIRANGLETIVVDFGVMGDPRFAPDVTADEVARAGGSSLSELRAKADKTFAMRTMSAGLAKVVADLHAAGRLDGILGMGGGGGTSIATAAMRGLPTGVPKLMVSTVAAGDIAPYVGSRDITMMPSVVDVAGLNSISRRIYTNAAAAMVGMVGQTTEARTEHRRSVVTTEEKPLITASMFGNTTPCINHAREILESKNYEVLVFHATGTGGRAMEELIADGYITANLDLTTTELADEVCGGVLSAGPDRLMASARSGVPTVIAPGCVDMANFGARTAMPQEYQSRLLYEWNSNVTLMRTNVDENRTIGEMIAHAANASIGPVAILIPLRGVSQLDSPGGAFWDPEADGACFTAIKENLRSDIPFIEMDNNINDPEFAERAVKLLLEML